MSTSTLALIIVTYTAIDGHRATRKYRTLDGARAFAQEYVGHSPSLGSSYAVSDDGVGKITVRGAALADLFPGEQHVEQCIRDLDGDREQNVGSADWFDEAGERAWQDNAAQQRDRILDTVRREPGCSCSEQQLNLVGCDCRCDDIAF